MCLFIIWFSLARLCPLFTPAGPEQTSPLAGVSLLQVPFCTLDGGKFISSCLHFMLTLRCRLHYPATPPRITFAVPVGTVISSARHNTDLKWPSPSGSVAFWQPHFELFGRKMLQTILIRGAYWVVNVLINDSAHLPLI